MIQNESIELVEKYSARNYDPLPVVISRGEGVYLWDEEGRKYIDMLSAYSAVSHGHRHPRILAAMREQSERLTLTSRAFHNDVMGRFLKRLCDVAGFERAMPMNTGAEAVDTAIKAMRKWAYEVKGVADGKARIVAASNNFHGRTLGAISLSTREGSRRHFGPLLQGIDIVPFGDAAALEKAIGDETAGFIVEPIQGEGGVIVPGDDYLPKVREICTRRRALLCLDEIQTGLGRTGKMFCFEHSGIRPDVLLIGKALGGGVYPVSAVCADDEVMAVFTPGTHGSTFGGNPLAAAVGIAALDVLIDEGLAEKAKESGEYFMGRLRAMQLPGVKEVRGRGLLIGMEFDAPVAREKALSLMMAGLLCRDARSGILRFAPPLVIERGQLDDALEIIDMTIGRRNV